MSTNRAERERGWPAEGRNKSERPCGAVLLHHGHATKRAVAFMHGITSSPVQFRELGELFAGFVNVSRILLFAQKLFASIFGNEAETGAQQ